MIQIELKKHCFRSQHTSDVSFLEKTAPLSGTAATPRISVGMQQQIDFTRIQTSKF